MEPDSRDFVDDVHLDKFDLDGESEKQASIYLHWSRKAAEARVDADRAELNYKFRRGEKATEFRASLAKATNDVVNEHLDSDSELRDMRTQFLQAQSRSYELDNGLRALQQKKDMIELLTKLHLNNYFATPGGVAKTDELAGELRSSLGSSRRHP